MENKESGTERRGIFDFQMSDDGMGRRLVVR